MGPLCAQEEGTTVSTKLIETPTVGEDEEPRHLVDNSIEEDEEVEITEQAKQLKTGPISTRYPQIAKRKGALTQTGSSQKQVQLDSKCNSRS